MPRDNACCDQTWCHFGRVVPHEMIVRFWYYGERARQDNVQAWWACGQDCRPNMMIGLFRYYREPGMQDDVQARWACRQNWRPNATGRDTKSKFMMPHEMLLRDLESRSTGSRFWWNPETYMSPDFWLQKSNPSREVHTEVTNLSAKVASSLMPLWLWLSG